MLVPMLLFKEIAMVIVNRWIAFNYHFFFNEFYFAFSVTSSTRILFPIFFFDDDGIEHAQSIISCPLLKRYLLEDNVFGLTAL